MSRLRAEDVKAALDDVMKCWTEQRPASVVSLMPLMSAAREWLASQEQTPDYEAARKAVVSVAGTGLGEDGYQKVWVDQHAEIIAQAAVDAALVGFHPQPTEGDEK